MRQPFFIVGRMRSGTTLLYRLLRGHPRVALTNEARVADFLAECVQTASIPSRQVEFLAYQHPRHVAGVVEPPHVELFSSIFTRHAIDALEDFYRERFRDKDFTHWGEKLPKAQTAFDLQEVYPHARYVVMMRDPRDNWCSFMAYRDKHRVDKWKDYTPAQHGVGWANAYRAFTEYLEHRLLVRYEDVLRDPGRELAEVLEFLGLEEVPGLDVAELAASSYRGHGSSTSAQQSIGRWRAELDADTIAAIEAGAGEIMQAHGYELA